MNDNQPTRPSLLIALREPGDHQAWRTFVEIYTPLIYGHCRRRGLQDADAADVTQEVMKSVAEAIRRFEYERSRGTFRAWLLTITRNKLSHFLARRAHQPQGTGDTAVHEFLDTQPDERVDADWETDYRQRLFDVAVERVRAEFQESTWQAFWRTAVQAEPVADVAAGLGLSAGAVYVARSRVIARLRTCVDQISEEGELVL
jgi:RNA polymerase sigma-70 factor (ECF subfamily)